MSYILYNKTKYPYHHQFSLIDERDLNLMNDFVRWNGAEMNLEYEIYILEYEERIMTFGDSYNIHML